MNRVEYGYDDAARGADFLRKKTREHGFDPDAMKDTIVLGSGLGLFGKAAMDEDKANQSSGPVAVPYDELYAALGLPPIEGEIAEHARKVIVGPLKGTGSDRLVVAWSGREHLYEGVSPQRATFYLRIMQLLGAKTLFSSNAAGIITPKTLKPPALLLHHSHSDRAIATDNPLIGRNDERLGPQFPHLMDLCPAETRAIVMKAARDLRIVLKEGTFIRFKGPNYESPDEISLAQEELETIWRRGRRRKGEKRFRGKFVGAVGMSTTPETRVAQHATQSKKNPAFLDGRAYVSALTNYAGSVGPNGFVKPSSHEEVKEQAALVNERFIRLARESILRMRK